MRTLLLLSLLLFTICLSAQWRKKYQGIDTTNEVKSVSFISPTTGYIATEDWIGFTTDSGQTVQRRYVTMNNIDFNNNSVNILFGFFVDDVYAFSADTLLLSGNLGFEPSILYSTNGGASWLLVFHRPIPINTVNLYNTVYQMEFPGRGSIGYAVHHDQVLKTTNRGQSWQVIREEPNQELHDISFINTLTGFAAGPERFLKTVDGGINWTVLNVPFGVQQLFAYSSQYIFVLSTTSDCYYSNNGGISWTQTNGPNSHASAYDMHYVNDSTGYIATGAIFQTRNRGMNWELMPGSENLNWVNKLRFWNNQLAWACTGVGALLITTNGGGVAHPKAQFTVNTSLTCSNATVQLINQSYSGYTYQWFRNNVLFATTYHASYTLGTSIDQIKLVVSNGTETDTLVEIVDPAAFSTITINSAPRNDTVCSNGPAVFDIFNSNPNFLYQVGRNLIGYTQPVYGNGGTLTLTIGTNIGEDSLSTFRVTAAGSVGCGSQTTAQEHLVRIIRTNPPTTALSDTVCTQGTFMIRVINSRPGYAYWADPGFPRVNGNGGTIQLPCRLQMSTSNQHITSDGTLRSHSFRIYNIHVTSGCGTASPVGQVTMIGRYSISDFDIIGYDWMTGDNLRLSNNSVRADTYLWRFPNGGNFPTSNLATPININYTTEGLKVVKLLAFTQEGCVDSSTRSIEIFTRTNTVPGENTCPGIVGNRVDSLRGDRQYYVSRSIYEDEYGNRIISGGYADMRGVNYSDQGFEGWFAIKFDKNGQVKWSLRQSTGDDYNSLNMNSHIIVEQAIGDSLGYTYLFGHSLNRTNVTTNGIDLFPIPKAGAFLVRLSPTGKIIWVKSFYNKDPFDEVNLLDYSGGSILRGKNDDVYVFTHKHSSGRFHVNNTQIFNFNQGLTGLIFHFDRNGNIIRMKNYPILENNLRRFTTYNTNSYDSLARAKWGPGGKMVIYGVLNPAQMSGNSIDGVTVPFNVNRVKSALLFFDTTNLNVTSIRPLYRNTPTGPVGIPIESFTVDDNGNYYASYSHQRTVVPQTSLTYPGDTVKIKTVICAFNTSGTLSWVKQAEGLQPKAMEVVSGQLKVAGSNYARHFFSSGLTIYSNQSPPLHSVNKLTLIGDTNSYAGVGAYGLGSYDLMVASFNPSNGSVLKLQHYGTGKDDESVVMTKGNGDQIWAAGTVGITFHNQPVADTTTTILTYKIAADNNCASTYRTLSPFLRLDLGDAGTNCIDSVIKIFWSSHAAGPVNLSFSLDNGNTYTTIASAVPVNTGVYNFNAAQAGAVGTVLFRIQDPANNLSDTARKLLVLRVTPEVTITASATTVCANTTVNFTATPANGGNAPSYQWFINNQTPSTNSPNWTWSSFTNGAQIKVIMTSNHVCRRTPTDTSNIITMTVSSSVTPAVSIAGNTTVTQGQSTPVTATPSNGGTAPVYQWQDSTAAHGWQNIPGATSSTYNYSPAATGDKIRCNVTSNASCVSQATVVSAALAFTVNAVTSVGPSPASEFGIQLYPNPSIASFTIDTLKLSHRWETLDVISMDGRHKLIHMNIINKQRVDVDIRKLSAAMYTVILRRKNGSPVYIKFVKQ